MEDTIIVTIATTITDTKIAVCRKNAAATDQKVEVITAGSVFLKGKGVIHPGRVVIVSDTNAMSEVVAEEPISIPINRASAVVGTYLRLILLLLPLQVQSETAITI